MDGSLTQAEWSGERRSLDGRRLHLRFRAWEVEWDGAPALQVVVVDDTARVEADRALHWRATHDELTGLPNRNALLQRLRDLFEQPVRLAFALILMDVDRFKFFNEAHGQSVGDEVLKRVAHVLRSNLRDADRVGRIGGEEFLVVLGTADMDDARQVAERLRHLISQLEVSCDEGKTSLSVTISIGLTQSQVFDEDWASVVSRADQGLYKAKRSGRDCVIVADALTRVEHRKDWHCDS